MRNVQGFRSAGHNYCDTCDLLKLHVRSEIIIATFTLPHSIHVVQSDQSSSCRYNSLKKLTLSGSHMSVYRNMSICYNTSGALYQY